MIQWNQWNCGNHIIIIFIYLHMLWPLGNFENSRKHMEIMEILKIYKNYQIYQIIYIIWFIWIIHTFCEVQIPIFPKHQCTFDIFWYFLCVKFLGVIDVIVYLMGIICIMEIKGLPLHPNQPNTSHISHIFFCPHHESCNGQRPVTSEVWMANGKICQGCEWLDKHQQTKIFLQFTMISTIIYDIYIIYNIYNSLTWIKII